MLRNKILNKEKTIGMYVQLTDISISKIVGLCGYDFIWIDNEHSYMTSETLFSHILTLRSTNTPVVVRVPQDDLTSIKKTIEMGVDGIIFPMIRTADEANRLVAHTLYPPYGTRGFGPMNAIDYGLKNPVDYMKNTKDELCRFIQIEHKDAIDNLDEIMENPYIDGYIFGPNDLSASYDMPGQVFTKEVSDIISGAIKKLRAKGKYVGIASGGITEEILSHWASFGCDMLCGGADFDYIRNGALSNKTNLEKALNKV